MEIPKTKFIAVNSLRISPEGKVYFANRQLHPDKTGLFPAIKYGEYITTEEILEACNNEPAIAKGLDKQIRHANICPIAKDGTKDYTPLAQWREKAIERKEGKSQSEIRKMVFY